MVSLFFIMKLSDIKYLSDKRILDLKKLGITSIDGLINNFPRSYLDMTKITQIKYAYHNEFVLTVAKVETEPRVFNSGRVKYVKLYCSHMSDTFSIVWFNQPYVVDKLKVGEEYFFYGRVSNKLGLVSMTNPIFEPVDKNYKLKGLVPVYSIKGNLTQNLMRSFCLSGVELSSINTAIPDNLVKKYALTSLKKSYYEVHSPTSQNSLNNASERIALEEYFKMISAFKVIKGDKKCLRFNKYVCESNDVQDFAKRFNFEFTDGQKKAVNEIFTDLTSDTIMNRLLQGDVGSGKTAVSLCAVYMAVKSLYQVTFLAPTEVLARQNYEVLQRYLYDYNIAFLSGSVSAKEKKEIKQKIINGEVDIVVGTHAILQDDVKFKNLALCVCDEQQRFGVAQRSSLSDKGKAVDVLVMSATPIPRTLSLIFYGDLDISTILDKPSNRIEIQTGIVPQSKYLDMMNFIKKEINLGRQVYFVCPKIEGDDEGTLISVKEMHQDLLAVLPEYKIGLLHGKMKDSEKTKIMTDFKNGEYDILVSTTVIEVGVDVPNATIMVINNAERFGLSQLHQLRGRVGRSNLKSYCFLLCANETDKAKERLNAIKNCSDGFKISEIDYDIRGGGDFLGEKQSGKFITRLGGLKYSSSVIFFAKRLSDEAFLDASNIETFKKLAILEYERLKNVTLN